MQGHVTAGHRSCRWSGRCCCSCTADRCLQLHASISHSSLHADWKYCVEHNSDKMWIFLYLTLSSSALHPLCSLLCLQSVSPSSPPPSPGHIQPLHHSSTITLPPRSCSANQEWKLQTAMNAEVTRIWRCRKGGQSSQVFDPNFYDPLCSTFNLI